MSLDRATLARTIAAHGPVVRVVVAEVKGSAPREVGAAMLVWRDGQSGTIGGGTLEFDATLDARAMLDAGETHRFTRATLGPDLGQCCGGAVALVLERWDAGAAEHLGTIHTHPVEGAGVPTLAVQRILAEARGAAALPRPQLVDGWWIEPVATVCTPVWVWGAGHVGRALIDTLAPLPDLAITWIDTAPERFPQAIPESVARKVAPDIAAAVAEAPARAHHLVMTYSHQLDFALCDALLDHGFATAGLIGSATKWARFRSRLGHMGHGPASIARIRCPIGVKALGKHPGAIAVGVAYGLLMDVAKKEATGPSPGDWEFGDDGRALDA